MGKVMRVCRVCGKGYEACYTRNTTGVFRWRDVACSIECGQKYLEKMSKQTPETEAEIEMVRENIRTEMIDPSDDIN